MTTDTHDDRLANIETRLAAIEARLDARPDPTPEPTATAPTSPPSRMAPAPQPVPRPSTPTVNAAALMALTAGIAFVLALVYLIRLVYDAGWLGPATQVALAAVAGMALVAGGLALARLDRAYAAWLPAVGLVALYLALYGGHLYYALLPTPAALAGIAAVTLLGIWLSRQFDNSVYTLFAVAGVYLTPLLLESMRADVLDLVVYYSAWSLLFSFAALQEQRRLTYLLACLFAVIGFDIAWRLGGQQQWLLAVLYQLGQFLVFAVTTWAMSVRTRQPMGAADAALHGLALFYFYAVEYIALRSQVPDLAPWLALASVAVVLGLFVSAHRRLPPGAGAAGAVLVSAYAALVTGHVVFFELLPRAWLPWASLLLPVAIRLSAGLFGGYRGAMWPLVAVGGGLFVMGFFCVLAGRSLDGTPVAGGEGLLGLYAVLLYLAWVWLRRDANGARYAAPLLYAGHLALLVLTLKLLDSELLVSLTWGGAAIALLLLARRLDDRVLGQSSLLVFVAAGIKVLLYDLGDADPGTRVLVLVVLAASLYAGGWLYQRLSAPPPAFTGKPEVDRQLALIRDLVEGGLDDAAVVAELQARGEPCLAAGGAWDVAQVADIRQSFGFSSAHPARTAP